MVPKIKYLDWITGRPSRAVHDLGSSDLQWSGDDPLQPVPLGDTSESAAERTFRASVASEYDVDPEQVLVTAGAAHANFLACAVALDGSRERVLVERPGYEPLWRTPELVGAEIDRFDRLPEAEYALDPASVAPKLDETTALVTVTNRHNPSGRLVDREALSTIAGTVGDRGACLLVDEVYAPFGAEPRSDRAFGGPTAAGLANVVVTGSLTKFQGLDGLRAGWLIADESFVEQARSVHNHLLTVSEPGVELGRQALTRSDELSTMARSRIAANATTLRSYVEERDDLSGSLYEGSSFAFLRHDRANGDAVTDAAWEEGILVVPGRFFDDRDRFRVSLAGEPATMSEALAALGTVLDGC